MAAMGHHDSLAGNAADVFDGDSGSRFERAIFNHRLWVLLGCMFATLVLGYEATRLQLSASFERTIPTSHPYVRNYLENRDSLKGLGNSVRIAVSTSGSIFDARYMETLRKISDEVYLLPGVDRPFMKSLWTSNTRWISVTEEGLEGGPVIPDTYKGDAASLEELRRNVLSSGEIGQLVSPDFKSSVILVPLLAINTETGQALDYADFGNRLETIRARYETDGTKIYVVGFAKVISDLIGGLRQIGFFFAIALVLAAAMLYAYTRCVRSTALVLVCSMVAVVWQLGLLPALGYQLDPYSILVPFLIFAIGMSHGAQKMNGIMQDVGRGSTSLVAARKTFRRLFLAGLTALLCDVVGFAVLLLIPIRAIQDLALISSIGVGVLIVTNLILLPVLLSYTGVSAKAARRTLVHDGADASAAKKAWLWEFFDLFTRRRWAGVTLVISAALAVVGYRVSTELKIGDLDPGAPELRADSRYNRDAAFVSDNYGASTDVLAVMVKTPEGSCARYDTLAKVDALEWELRQLPGVVSTASLAGISRGLIPGFNEGNGKWAELLPTQSMLNSILVRVPPTFFNNDCSLLSLFAYLSDHKADTLTSVVNKVESFRAENNGADAQFLLAAGNAGIEAATNIVVKKANTEMLYWVYAAVIVLCLITFRSWRAVVCAVLPLMLTSLLCEVLMVQLRIGLKVATLPVIALGVGIGVDYALYVMSVLLSELRAGRTLSQAYLKALRFTGRVVLFTGCTLAAGVATWAFSPIKFQADMGILLAFMFLWNMLGALILLPALAAFLLPVAKREPVAASTESEPQPQLLS